MSNLLERLQALEAAQTRLNTELAEAAAAGDLAREQRAREEGEKEAREHQEAIEGMVRGVPQTETYWLDNRDLVSRAAKAEGDDAAKEILVSALPDPPRRSTPASEGLINIPDPLLSAYGQGGALLVPGEVCLLSGAGMSAKSTLALNIALQLAAVAGGVLCDLPLKLFQGVGGPVLIATFEDSEERVKSRLRRQAEMLERTTKESWSPKRSPTAALSRVHVLPMRGRPLYGPAADGTRTGLYNQRPEQLAGWGDLWKEARRVEARVIVIDPALAAFVGESNAAAPVREFLMALGEEAAEIDAGVLLIAHSNKAARNKRADAYDAGHVGGSSHWTDGVRAVMTLGWQQHEDKDEKGKPTGSHYPMLRVPKANYGPAFIECRLDPLKTEEGEPLAFWANIDGWTGLGAKKTKSARSPADDL